MTKQTARIAAAIVRERGGLCNAPRRHGRLRVAVGSPHHGRMSRWTFGVMLLLAGCDAGTGTPDAGTPADATADAGNTRDGAGEQDAAPPLVCPGGSARIEQRCDPALVPCGGEVSGEHCYAEVCFEKDELLSGALVQPGFPDGCTIDGVELRGSTGTIEGSITFTGTELTRSVRSTVTGTFWLPPQCQIVAGDCEVTESFLDGALAPGGSATCEADADGCVCAIELESEAHPASPYTIEGNTIVTDAGRRFDYCVETEGGLRFREEAASGAEPGIATVLPAEG
jgi:hypothetical protein